MKSISREIVLKGNIPTHIAIIMDGNGRWAKSRLLPRVAGHKEGINSVREITRVCGEIGVKHLTLFTFSKENWKRPRSEVNALMSLLLKTINIEVKALHKNNVKFKLKNLEKFYSMLVHIPCGWWVTKNEREKIVKIINSVNEK